ncbi:MAG: SAM-dependent methyltransferase [Myxococcales bacterium]|nr:SAM-dependent methyltransferase [Myxococcales bacterium]
MQVTSGALRFTFRGNLRETRHGWLRLTPAYSLHLVRALAVGRPRTDLPVLDPFCGTGTTLLACSELEVPCDTLELNPFLVWLARAKVARYDRASVSQAETVLDAAARRAALARASSDWTPPLHNIERWWDSATLGALSRAFAQIQSADLSPRARDLCRLAFCRTLVAVSSASFRHQSMSFAQTATPVAARARARVATTLRASMASLAHAAAAPLPATRRKVVQGDARTVARALGDRRYGAVITSPPYANRMSYIRELRPYMYWLGHLSDGRAAGALDWKAIGGTWGQATSNLIHWRAPGGASRSVSRLAASIAKDSEVLSRYVERYFVDMAEHLASLRQVVADGGSIHYVVGNSKFFDVVVPVEEILAAQMKTAGFSKPRIERLRKRTSKKELYEFAVSATG